MSKSRKKSTGLLTSGTSGTNQHVISKTADAADEEKMAATFDANPESPGSPKGSASMSVKIFSRIRKLMPWEPTKTSVKRLNDNTLQNKTDRAANQYSFAHVFGMNEKNDDIYDKACKPLVKRVLEGYNAVLIAYGQTGSGKTHTLVGKPEQNVVGILIMVLTSLLQTKSVQKVELSAIEAYGTHVSRIELFDLFNEINGNPLDWSKKEGSASFDPTQAIKNEIKSLHDCHKRINEAHSASHFAPTGKNPESSRGHVAFVARVTQVLHGANMITSNFVCVDLAGSEGESAFTQDFIAKVDATTLMARRLEAGVINTGLSQLQVVFAELKKQKQLSSVRGNGLRRILHAYINTSCMISVVFTISPAINNAVSTASTLKFAVQAGMVKVKPVKAKKKLHLPLLVEQLEAHISEQAKIIDNLRNDITNYEVRVASLTDELEIEKIEKEKLENQLKNQLEKEKSSTEFRSQRSMEYLKLSNENKMELKQEKNELSIDNSQNVVSLDSNLTDDTRDKSQIFESDKGSVLSQETQLKKLDLETQYLKMGSSLKKIELKMEYMKTNNDAKKLELETEYMKVGNDKRPRTPFSTEYMKQENEQKGNEFEMEFSPRNDDISNTNGQTLPQLETQYMKMSEKRQEIELQMEYLAAGKDPKKMDLEMQYLRTSNKQRQLENQVKKFKARTSNNSGKGLRLISESTEDADDYQAMGSSPLLSNDKSNSVLAGHTKRLSESTVSSAKEIAANIRSFLNELREEAQLGYDTSDYDESESKSNDDSESDEMDATDDDDEKGNDRLLGIPQNKRKKRKNKKKNEKKEKFKGNKKGKEKEKAKENENNLVADDINEDEIDKRIRELNAARAQNQMDKQLIMDTMAFSAKLGEPMEASVSENPNANEMAMYAGTDGNYDLAGNLNVNNNNNDLLQQGGEMAHSEYAYNYRYNNNNNNNNNLNGSNGNSPQHGSFSNYANGLNNNNNNLDYAHNVFKRENASAQGNVNNRKGSQGSAKQRGNARMGNGHQNNRAQQQQQQQQPQQVRRTMSPPAINTNMRGPNNKGFTPAALRSKSVGMRSSMDKHGRQASKEDAFHANFQMAGSGGRSIRDDNSYNSNNSKRSESNRNKVKFENTPTDSSYSNKYATHGGDGPGVTGQGYGSHLRGQQGSSRGRARQRSKDVKINMHNVTSGSTQGSTHGSTRGGMPNGEAQLYRVKSQSRSVTPHSGVSRTPSFRKDGTMSMDDLYQRAETLEKQLNLERNAHESLARSAKNKTRLMIAFALAFFICLIIHVTEP